MGVAMATELKQNGVPREGSRSRRVLVVEDDGVIRDALIDGLDAEGFAVQEAADGEEALRLIKDEAPDLILLDLMMPKMTGWQLMEELRREPGLHDIPIVIV